MHAVSINQIADILHFKDSERNFEKLLLTNLVIYFQFLIVIII